MCTIEELQIRKEDNVDDKTRQLRELYAHIVLLIFYLFRNLDGILGGSYWNMFRKELRLFKNNGVTTFWKHGFTIIQNIQERTIMDKK